MTRRADHDLVWVRDEDPVWDNDKRRIIGGAPDGAFVLPFREGDELPGEWWSAREGGADGAVVGYGRLDISWGGDAEILLAVDRSAQQRGIGSFVLASLEAEAERRGINYVYNVIRDHAQREYVHDWLVVRGFRGAIDGDLRKRVVGSAEPDQEGEIRQEPHPEPASQQDARGPGQENQGGYVDVEEHQY